MGKQVELFLYKFGPSVVMRLPGVIVDGNMTDLYLARPDPNTDTPLVECDEFTQNNIRNALLGGNSAYMRNCAKTLAIGLEGAIVEYISAKRSDSNPHKVSETGEKVSEYDLDLLFRL